MVNRFSIMTERESFRISEQKAVLLERDHWTCRVCGQAANQLAHRIPQSKMNIKKYGKHVIHHSLNLVSVCSLRCNSSVIINGLEEKSLVADILALLDGG